MASSMTSNNISTTSLNFAPKIKIKEVGKDGRTKSATSDGGYLFDNEEEIQKQRGSLWDMVKKIGSNLLEGKDLVNVSMPVYLFEPRSFVHRVCDSWAMYHELLVQAAKDTDPVARFARVIAFSLSGLHQTATALKPFNPILGETYEAEYLFNDESKNADVFVEQISHHPPITAWELISRGGLFRYTGTAGYIASIRGNSLKGGQSGPHKVTFHDGTVITYELPLFWLKGIMWGDRVMEYYGSVKYVDETNGLTCELSFHPDQQGWVKSFFKSSKTPSDTVRGEIKNSSDKTIACVEGTWLGFVDLVVNGKSSRLWSIDQTPPQYPKPKDAVLPSDARHRKDLKALLKGDLEEAQKWKEIMEDKQRQEKKLRTSRKASAAAE